MLLTKSLACVLTLLLCQQAVAAEMELTYQGNDGSTDRLTIRGIEFAEPGFVRQNALETNPLITGHNLYATDMLRVGDSWAVFYGGWLTPSQPNDMVYSARTNTLDVTDGWESLSQLAIHNGSYLHVNDPSVVKTDTGWRMAYTAARYVGSDFRDWIETASSPNGVSWTVDSPRQPFTMADPSGLAGGTVTDIARPSLVRVDDGWRMWFDASTNNGPVHSYVAESVGDNVRNWQIIHRYDDVAGFPGFYEPDVVRRPDGSYLAVVQRHFANLYLATSDDGIEFTLSDTPVLTNRDPMLDVLYISNPGLMYDSEDDKLHGVSFGMTESPVLTGHDIGFAYSQYDVAVRSTDGSWHNVTAATALGETAILVEGATNFDLLRISDPISGELLLEAPISAVAGDVFEVAFVPEPSATLLLVVGLGVIARCSRRPRGSALA